MEVKTYRIISQGWFNKKVWQWEDKVMHRILCSNACNLGQVFVKTNTFVLLIFVNIHCGWKKDLRRTPLFVKLESLDTLYGVHK